jgi:hypothetical protein
MRFQIFPELKGQGRGGEGREEAVEWRDGKGRRREGERDGREGAARLEVSYPHFQNQSYAHVQPIAMPILMVIG